MSSSVTVRCLQHEARFNFIAFFVDQELGGAAKEFQSGQRRKPVALLAGAQIILHFCALDDYPPGPRGQEERRERKWREWRKIEQNK